MTGTITKQGNQFRLDWHNGRVEWHGSNGVSLLYSTPQTIADMCDCLDCNWSEHYGSYVEVGYSC